MPIHSGTSQKVHQQLVSKLEAVLPTLMADAIEEVAGPLRAEAENCKKLVNDAQAKALSETNDLKTQLATKQGEILSLRTQLEDERQKVVEAGNTIGAKQAEIEELKKIAEPARAPEMPSK